VGLGDGKLFVTGDKVAFVTPDEIAFETSNENVESPETANLKGQLKHSPQMKNYKIKYLTKLIKICYEDGVSIFNPSN
jgi:hypothetical protein